MNKVQFVSLVEKHLLSLLGGSLVGEAPSTEKQLKVAYLKPNILAVKPSQHDLYRLKIWRSQQFSKEERALAEAMVNEIVSLEDADPKYYAELEEHLTRRVIVEFLGNTQPLAEIIMQLEKWAAQTYEGGRISSAIGLLHTQQEHGDISISDFFNSEFSPLISNGFDTIAVFDSEGIFVGEQALPAPSDEYTSPYRLSAIANWAKDNLAVVLNRHGEIIIFSEGLLKFAKRSGKWFFYAHDPVVASIKYPKSNKRLRQAIYASCLDVSFSRSGGCFAILSEKVPGETISKLIKISEAVVFAKSCKAKCLKSITANRSIDKIDRRIRQELLGIDGAFIVNRHGVAVDIGTIVMVPAGSDGGGRLAAAKT